LSPRFEAAMVSASTEERFSLPRVQSGLASHALAKGLCYSLYKFYARTFR